MLIDLIITYGLTDIQLLLQNSATGKAVLAKAGKDSIKDLNNLLETSLDQVDIIFSGNESVQLALQEKVVTIGKVDKVHWRFWSEDGKYLFPPTQKIQVVLPKVDQVILALKENYEIDRILLLGAKKGDNKEPYIFPDLFSKLLDSFTLHADITHKYLWKAGEPLEDYHGIYSLRPEFVRNINETLYPFFEAQDGNTDTVLLTTGGLPQIKPLLHELVTLYAKGNVKIIPALEERSKKSCLKSWELINYDSNREPVHIARIKRIALEWIRRGGFNEAYYTAHHLIKDPEQAEWIGPIEAVSDLIMYSPDTKLKNAQVGQSYEKIIELTEQNFLSPLIALRVESYLLNGRIIEALNTTSTFLDVLIDDFLRHDENISEYDPVKNQIAFIDLKGDLSPSQINRGKKKDVLKRLDENRYEIRYPTLFKEYMFEKYAKKYSSFKQINDFIHNSKKYRNQATHALLPRDHYDDVLEFMCRMVNESIWVWNPKLIDQGVQPGKAFWRSPVVQNVLRHLTGEDNLADLFEGLIDDLESKILNKGAWPFLH